MHIIIQMFENSMGFFFNICHNISQKSYTSDFNISKFLKISLNDYLDRLAKIGGNIYVRNDSYFKIKQEDVEEYVNKFKEEFVAELILAEMESDLNV